MVHGSPFESIGHRRAWHPRDECHALSRYSRRRRERQPTTSAPSAASIPDRAGITGSSGVSAPATVHPQPSPPPIAPPPPPVPASPSPPPPPSGTGGGGSNSKAPTSERAPITRGKPNPRW